MCIRDRGSFPEEFAFGTASGKVHRINYPGLILNVICAEHNTNHQYHTLAAQPDGSRAYEVSSKMSIEFEVDGPYLVRAFRTCLRALHLSCRPGGLCLLPLFYCCP